MKFNCDARKIRLEDWHKKFAWLPRKVGPNDCRWFEFVERKGTLYVDPFGESYEWSYRPFTGATK